MVQCLEFNLTGERRYRFITVRLLFPFCKNIYAPILICLDPVGHIIISTVKLLDGATIYQHIISTNYKILKLQCSYLDCNFYSKSQLGCDLFLSTLNH